MPKKSLIVPVFLLSLIIIQTAFPITEGYASKQSVFPGEAINFHVSTNASTFVLEVFRRGPTMEYITTINGPGGGQFTGRNYYQSGQNYPSNGCNWPAAATFTIPNTWKSGLYVVRIAATSDTSQVRMNYSSRYYQDRPLKARIIFLVKSNTPGVESKILMCLAFNTYQAYNGWGGGSYYYSGGIVSTVSFLRPYGDFDGYNQGPTDWDYKFIQWAESQGYVLNYCADSDMDWDYNLSRNFVRNYKLIVVNGHSEYWSAGMHDCIVNFQNQLGGNVFFCTGNTATPRVTYGSGYTRMTKGSSGWGVSFMGGEMQGNLFGPKKYTHYPTAQGFGGLTVSAAGETSWVFAGTGLQAGQQFGRLSLLVGYEADGISFNRSGVIFTPAESVPAGLQILAANTYTGGSKSGCKSAEWNIKSTFVIFKRGNGTFVHEGNVNWAYGLIGDAGNSEPGYACQSTYTFQPDPNVQIITKNILERLGEAGSHIDRSRFIKLMPAGSILARPNPFHQGVRLDFGVWGHWSSSYALLNVYNLQGRVVRSFKTNGERGYFHWDGKTRTGRPVAAGQYLIKLEQGPYRASKVITLSR